MKILQLIQKPQLRGAEIFAAQLSEQLTKKGHEIMLVSLFPGTVTLPFSDKQSCLAANPAKRFWDWSAWKRLANLIEEFQPDLIQANAGDTLKYAVSSKLVFRWKAKLIFRNANLISAFHKSSFQKFYNSFLMRNIEGVASVSELCKNDFLRTFDFPLTKIATLPIGVITPELKSEFPEDVKEKLGGSHFLIHIGSFVPEKNHLGLLRIFNKILLVHPELKILLVGEGRLKAELEEVHKNDKAIVFAGARADVSSILPFAKVLLLPSLIEGLPGVILEAMISKVAVVAYDVGGISEVIIQSQSGFIIPARKEKMFADSVVQLLDMEPKKLDLMLQLGKEQIVKNYAMRTIATRFELFYKEMITPGE